MFKPKVKSFKHYKPEQQQDRSKVDQVVLQSRTNLGAYGESLAKTYLEAEGYIIEAKNWRGQRGEIDLVVRKDSILVIVEVRTTSTSWLERPAEATPLTKQKQVARCADEYIKQRNQHSVPNIDYIRFDVIGLLVPKISLEKDSKDLFEHSEELGIVIDHVENAYTSPWAF